MKTNSENFDLNTIMKNHYHEIFHYVRKQTQNIEDAKDLTQDVFMKVHTKLHTYDASKASMRTWLYRIAHHHVVNFYRKAEYLNRANVASEFIENLPSDEDVLAQAIQHENIAFVLKMMDQHLNKKHYKIMNLYFFSELSVETISETLNIPVKTVYNTINNSVKKIKSKMEVIRNE